MNFRSGQKSCFDSDSLQVVHFRRNIMTKDHWKHMPDISQIFSSVALPKDFASVLSFVFLFIGISLAVGFAFGRNKLVNVFINIYIALAFVSVLPDHFLIDSEYANAGFFFFLLVFLTAIDQHLFDLHIPNTSYDIFWRMFVMSGLVVGMTVSVVTSLIPKRFLSELPFPFLYDFFGGQIANVLWLSLPIFVLLFMNKRLR